MKLLVVVVIAISAFCAFAERPVSIIATNQLDVNHADNSQTMQSVPLTQMGWSTMSPAGEISTVATKKDLLVYLDVSAGSSPSNSNGKRDAFGLPPPPAGVAAMSVRRRNADGVYEFVGNFTEAASPYSATNGKWVAMFNGGAIGLFRVDANNQMSNLSTIPNSGVQGGFLLSDDTFVGFDSVSPLDDGNYTIRTFEYEASNNTWQEVPGTGLVIAHEAASAPQGISTCFASDTHLVVLDPSNSTRFVVNIYERQADKSWKFVESVPVNNTIGYVNYNSVDTLTVWGPMQDESGVAVGVLFVYTKVNGKWIDQRFSTTSVGWRPVGYFGIITAFLDANNVLVNAPFEGFTGSGVIAGGKLLLMTRTEDGLWEPAADLTGSGLFGTAIGFNDYDIVVPSFNLASGSVLTYYTAPICFYQPINVTCNNQQVSSCSQVDLTSLYTVNNPQCGAVTATLGGFGLVDNKALQAQFTFTKGFGASYSCNATVSCPVPPIAIQQTPSKVSSSVVGVQFGIASIFGCFVSFLFM